MSGWFAVKRGITSHPLFKGHPERLAIWLWLLDNAVWQDTPHDIKGHTVIVKRGSVCASERRIADEVGVGYQVVRTFLARLKADHMINAEVTHGRSIISLCNYERYQSAKPSDNAQGNATLTQPQRTKEQGNKGTKEEEAKASLSAKPTLPDLAHVDEISQAVSAYNEAAQTAGWAKVQKLSRERRVKLAARLKEAGGIEGWRFAMSKARASPLCTGDNERGWVASFDFLISKEKFTRLMEGQYDDRRSSRPRPLSAANSHASDRAIAFASRAVRTPSKDCF